jgi:hypothetical protein
VKTVQIPITISVDLDALAEIIDRFRDQVTGQDPSEALDSIRYSVAAPRQSYRTELEQVYKILYPKKVGKTPGLAILSKQIRTPEDLEAFTAAVTRYAKSKVVIDGFPMGFDRFARQWRDWLDESAGQQGAFLEPQTLKGIDDLKREETP